MTCNIDLRKAGNVYPRTCEDCGLGPCKKYLDRDKIAAEEEKAKVCDFVKNDLLPLIEQQSGKDSERHRLLRLIYFVLRNRTVENWGPHELTMDIAMRLP